MGSGFKGRFKAQLDAKQRVAVPAKLRRNSPGGTVDQFTITLGMDGCLYLYPPEQWDRTVARLENASGDQARFAKRMLLSNAEDVELDGQGRILVPQSLIEKAKLEKEVLFVGNLDHIEIWRPDAFEEYLQGRPDTYEQVAGEYLL